MARRIPGLTLFLALLTGALTGCEQEAAPPAIAQPEPAFSRVLIPDAVAEKWRAVKIAVRDAQTGRETVYTVDIGFEFALDEDLRVRVENFLPAFVMDGAHITSASNLPKNPAARIVITERGVEVYRGWLFSRYPDAHPFQHPRYTLTLVDFVPAGGKRG